MRRSPEYTNQQNTSHRRFYREDSLHHFFGGEEDGRKNQKPGFHQSEAGFFVQIRPKSLEKEIERMALSFSKDYMRRLHRVKA